MFSVTSTDRLLNGTIINWFSKKQIKTLQSSSNAETIAMYTGVVDQNWMIMCCRSIEYPIGSLSKLYEGNQATTKPLLPYIITPQAGPIKALINSLREYQLWQTFSAVYTLSNMKLTVLHSKPHIFQSLRNIVGCSIVARFYPLSGSAHHTLLHIDQFHSSNHRQMPSNGKSSTIQSYA